MNINGTAKNEKLIGTAGADNINGGGGHDYIDGGAGNDILTGGAGHDLFVLKAGGGHDVVTDFNPVTGGDALHVEGPYVLTGIDYNADGITDTEVTVGGDSLILLGVNPSDISDADFYNGSLV